jgi:hypothetical protein
MVVPPRYVKDFSTSAEYEHFSLAYFKLDLVIRAPSNSVTSNPFKLLSALFQINTVH